MTMYIDPSMILNLIYQATNIVKLAPMILSLIQ